MLHVGTDPWVAEVELIVRMRAFGPFETPPTAQSFPEAGTAVAETDVVVSGAGDVTVDLGPVAGPGFYTVVAEVIGADQTEIGRKYLAEDVTTTFGDPAETSVVRWTPTIDTAATAVADATIDQVTIRGLPELRFDGDVDWAADPGTVTQTLYGPYPNPPGVGDCTADHVSWTTTIPAANGIHSVTSPDGLEPGWYTWTSELAGAGRISGVVVDCGLPNETVEVAAPAALPSPKTPELAETGADPALARLGLGSLVLAAAAFTGRAAVIRKVGR